LGDLGIKAQMNSGTQQWNVGAQPGNVLLIELYGNPRRVPYHGSLCWLTAAQIQKMPIYAPKLAAWDKTIFKDMPVCPDNHLK
jgi:hypothetical protein